MNLQTPVHSTNQAKESQNRPPLGSTPPASASGSTSNGDHSLYKAMMMMTIELGVLASAQTSVAELSTALYDHMVPNATNQLKKMQKNLDDYTWLQQHFTAFAKYFAGKGPKPPLGPGMSAGDLKIMHSFYSKHSSLTAARSAIGTQAQEISVQNTFVQDSKALPDGLQNDVKTLANSEVQDSSQIPSLLMLMKEFFTTPWR